MKIKPLNKLCDEWSNFSSEYVVGDDGYIYRRLKSNYQTSKKYPYQQIRNRFGTDKQHTVKLHKAVALAFVENPNMLTDIDHIDNNKLNNSADNLQWLPHADNVRKSVKKRRDNETL